MEDSNYLKSVAQFQKTFSQPVLDKPTLIPIERAGFRVDLLKEELTELVTAINENNIVEVADALGDLQYVLSGAVLEFGFADRFKEIFDEIHRSNMSKECKTIEEAQRTQNFYLLVHEPSTHTYVKTTNTGTFLVLRKSDHKVLKSVDYSPASLQQFIF